MEASPSQSSGCSVPQSSAPPRNELQQDVLETEKGNGHFKTAKVQKNRKCFQHKDLPGLDLVFLVGCAGPADFASDFSRLEFAGNARPSQAGAAPLILDGMVNLLMSRAAGVAGGVESEAAVLEFASEHFKRSGWEMVRVGGS